MTNPMPELSAQLKQLRLSHITDKLQLRNREAIGRKLSYPEFLALLLQDELLGRENSKFRARIKRAHLSGDKTLESFDFDFNPKINRAQIQDLASCAFILYPTRLKSLVLKIENYH